ncbi:MAG: AhpC/TSA family protein [Dysgonamonadaceae bacterium]|nr:AhpC/TSA family protein [Dysgonamonadaceae bacterium]
MKRIVETAGLLAIACLLSACGGKKQSFTIDGEIAGGAGKTLYLENVGITKIVAVDSLRLQSESFRFRQARPAYPDFYRLRLGRQVINLAIDSTETIHIQADTAHFAHHYTLEGDVASSQKLRELTLLQNATAAQYRALQKQYEAGECSIDRYSAAVDSIIDAYKTAARAYIFPDFQALPAYFALFQQINNLFIFDMYNKADNKLFGAVANSWNTIYPESPRALQLKQLFTGARAVIRGEQQTLPVQETDSKTLFDISLPSLENPAVRLSEIGDGKWTLVDFTAYAGNYSPAHNLQLAELYSRYRSKGLEIYQVSLDSDSHFWKNAAVNLPWYCVRDAESIYSAIAQKYNVVHIPSTFLRDGKGEIVARIEDYGTLEATVAQYLK